MGIISEVMSVTGGIVLYVLIGVGGLLIVGTVLGFLTYCVVFGFRKAVNNS